jgi:RimJ/RimL family protein N-acetyltransferase
VTIRALTPTDPIPEVHALVRAAYQGLSDMGFRYWGTWQSEEDTLGRCREGHCLVALEDGRIVGTLTAKRCGNGDDEGWYREPGVWCLTQFAVLPGMQGAGVGSRLMAEAERHAFQQGAIEAAVDTAEGATHLIEFYSRRGYRHVGRIDWDGTNYVSVVMSKRLRPVLTTERLIMRDLTREDIPAIQSHWSDPRFQEKFPPERLTPEHCLEIFEPEIRRLAEFPRTGHHWAIEREGEMIGTMRLSFERGGSGSVGYGLSAVHWGKGYATEAVREVVRYAFDECGLHRLQAFVFTPNEASKHVLRKCGFVPEGALREKVPWGDTRVDDEIFGLLLREWRG